MKKAIARQIVHLLNRSHKPRVSVYESKITGENGSRAGRGVFSEISYSSNDLPVVMCVYPGTHTPGIPLHAMGRAEYLANRSPPSDYGTDVDENAYIMNLGGEGYIDGRALQSQYDGRGAMDENPSACGHLVNHGGARSNVEVLPFSWEELTNVKDGFHAATSKGVYYPIPNELRADGTPWYFDTWAEEVVSFPSGGRKSLPRKILHGAALILSTPIARGEELLLDYGLKKPYPAWATGWYNASCR